jgi:methylenetetrahydrofolate dehydrogenase (NADP+) / methenyltetrahydrofolate cyclohydrolase
LEKVKLRLFINPASQQISDLCSPINSHGIMQLIDGKQIALTIQQELAEEVQRRVAAGKHKPHLAAVLVGNDGGSVTYVNAKVAACDRIGYRSTLIRLEDTVSESALLEQVQLLNNNPEIDGFIVQLPLPKHINTQHIIEAIDPAKDVDGFHPVNVGRMALNLPGFLPATPYGILQLFERCGIKTAGCCWLAMPSRAIVL